MKRKVIKQGHNTLTITLPAEWVKKKKIVSGDELELIDKDGSLLIVKDQNNTLKQISLDIHNMDINLLKRYINTLYKMGYDEVNLHFDNVSIVSSIQEILQKNLIGYEIIKQTKEGCTIKSLSIMVDSEFDNSLRRTFLLLLSLSEEILDALRSRDLNHLKTAALLEENNNRLTTYCRRILNKNGHGESDKLAFIYYIIEELEKIADEFKYLAEYIDKGYSDLKELDKSVLEFFEDVNSFVRDYYTLFYSEGNEKILLFYNKKKTISSRGYKLISKSTNLNTIILHHLMTILQDTYDILPHYIALTIKT